MAYIYLLTFASLLPRPALDLEKPPNLRFAVAIPAHNEASVIHRTISSILSSEYPSEWLDVFVVADHCSDETAQIAWQCGAIVFECNQGERGKGPALSWLFKKIFESNETYQAIAVFDADTVVHPHFFKVMSARLSSRSSVVQGQHIIRNPGAGWFPALTWAMFMIDNRFENLGRSNLGFSAKNMGDSICFRSEILQRYGWGSGLTEDFAFRQQLLLEGIRIHYEPQAIGSGDAPQSWKEASPQRQRWMRGAYRSSRQNALAMLKEGLKHFDLALLDGAMYAYLPAYSTLTMLTCFFSIISICVRNLIWAWLPMTWISVCLLLFLFPLTNLAFDRAPLKAFLIILTGPVFILWRSWLGIYSRFLRHEMDWVRTSRHL